MNKNVLFLQGGAGEEDHTADARLVDSLRKNLGSEYEVHYPLLKEDSTPYMGLTKQIENAISVIRDEVILVAHSLGASMLLKYLSENRIQKKMNGIFLIATPYWSGDEDWKQGLKLSANFSKKLPKDVPIFLYHSREDETVPFDHLNFYKRHLPQATVREVPGGHQLNDDLSEVARDIREAQKTQASNSKGSTKHKSKS